MLYNINLIRNAFGLPNIDKLSEGKTNLEIVENSLGQGSKLTFRAGTNWIDVEGPIYSGEAQKIIEAAKSMGLDGFVGEDGFPVIITPNDIRDFLKQ